MAKNSNELAEETERLGKENAALHLQIREVREYIDAINTGNVDAVVIADKKHLKVYTEKTADRIYRILIEKMNEGAVTLNEDGTILYCNSYFANIVNLPLQKIPGTKFKNFIDDPSKGRFETLLQQGRINAVKEEVYIYTSDGKAIPVLMSVNTLSLDNDFILSIILTDLTVYNKNQEELKRRARQLEQKNLELESANKELAFQNQEKEKRAAELSIANKELAFQNEEKEKRATELSHANKELTFQNKEKEKRAAELSIANKELAFQNEEKEKRAAELSIANKELAFQNEEKEKRATELSIANKDLTAFTYLSSHDLQEPLRKIQTFVSLISDEEHKNLSDNGKDYFRRMQETAKRMQALIEDLLIYSRTKITERNFEKTDPTLIVDEVKKDFEEVIREKKATIEAAHLCLTRIIPFQFRQLIHNLISNSLKFSNPERRIHIIIKSEIVKGCKLNNEKLSPETDYCHIIYTDNGIGFDPQYKDRIFEVFQRLHSKETYPGTGMGLAICKRVVENHNGIITATGQLNKGARFDIYIPAD